MAKAPGAHDRGEGLTVKLSVVTTIYRSRDCIEEFHRRAAEAAASVGADLETIFVNDGSPDDGWSVAQALARGDARVVAIDLSRNFGQHKALWAGLEIASGDLIAVFDGDLEEDPRWLVDFHRVMTERGCDVVYGLQNVSFRGPLYKIGRRIFYRLVNTLSSVSLPENVATARLMTRRYVDAALKFEEREMFLAGLLWASGFDQVGVPVTKERRAPSSYGTRRLLRLFLYNVTSFSVRPLIGIFLVGFGLSVLAGLFILALFIQRVAFGIGVPGWASIMAVVLFFCGMTIFFNGVIAIYVATIFLEVKKRPRVIIRDVVRQTSDQTINVSGPRG